MKKDNVPDIEKKVGSALDQLNSLRKTGFGDLLDFHRIKSKALEREKDRLVKSRGINDPTVKRMEAKIGWYPGFIGDLETVKTQTEIDVEPVDDRTWMVHGQVVDGDRKGLPGLTIGLVDESGKWQKYLGYSCTDDRGYFSVRYVPGHKEKSETVVSFEEKLYLAVWNKQRRMLYQDQIALSVAPGRIDSRLIVIVDEGKTCTPPAPASGKTPVSKGNWAVKGRILDEQGQGASGLTVSLYDRDLLFDDYLKSTVTGKAGDFKLIYRAEGFCDLLEKNPDIYLKVIDRGEKLVYTSKKPMKFEIGKIEEFLIDLRTQKKK